MYSHGLTKIYGFGSYFAGADSFRDIDMLILHEDSKAVSIKAAIDTKTALARLERLTSCVMLSRKEEREKSFLSISHAAFLFQLDLGSSLSLEDRISHIQEVAENYDIGHIAHDFRCPAWRLTDFFLRLSAPAAPKEIL